MDKNMDSYQNYGCDRILLDQLTVPVPDNEESRLSVLRETQLLDSNANDPEYDRFTAMVKRIFKVPVALVSLIDVDRQWFKSKIGFGGSQTHRNLAFCSYTVLPSTEDVMVVLDALLDDRFKDSPIVVGAPHVRFYAGAAIVVDGRKIGSLCAVDLVPRTEFSLDMKMNLLDISAMVSTVISRRRHALLDIVNTRAGSVVDIVRDLRAPLAAMKKSIEWLAVDPIIKNSSDMVKEQVSIASAYLRAVGTDIEANLALAPIILRKKSTSHDNELEDYPPSGNKQDFELEECNVFDIVSKAKEIISTVSFGKHVEWHVDETYLLLGSHVSHPDVILYVILSAINRLVASWATVNVFFGFRKNLWSIDDDTLSNNKKYLIQGKLCIEVRADGKLKVDISEPTNTSEQISSTFASIRLLNSYYNVETLLQDIGGGSRSVEMSELTYRNDVYLAEYEYITQKYERDMQTIKTGLSLLLQNSNSYRESNHSGTHTPNIPQDGVKKLCEYWLPCRIDTSNMSSSPSDKQSEPLEVIVICPNIENADIQNLMAFIRSAGATVFATDRGNEGVDALLSGRYQVGIIDISTVHSSGASILQVYRNRRMQLANILRNHVSFHPRPLLLGVSMHQSMDDKNASMIVSSFGHGLNYFIASPLGVDKEALLWILQRCELQRNGFANAPNEHFGLLMVAINKYLESLPSTSVKGIQSIDS